MTGKGEAASDAGAGGEAGFVEFVSRGAILVCGPALLAIPAGEQLAKTLRVVVCTTDECRQTGLRANPIVMRGLVARVGGYLGRFSVEARAGACSLADIGAFSGNPDNFFDLVLDLNDPPLLAVELMPEGYRAPGNDRQALATAISELAGLKGSFRKPLGVVYDETRCVHSAQGVQGCSRCLETCPAGAIRTGGHRIEVDAKLCHGCAACMVGCPTGALGLPAALPAAILGQLATLMATRRAAGLPTTRLTICAQGDAEPLAGGLPQGPSHALLKLPAVGAAGPELWLAALASGIHQVAIRVPDKAPASARRELALQMDLARLLLAAMGEQPDRICLGDPAIVPDPAAGEESPRRMVVGLGMGRREALDATLDSLLAKPGPQAAGGAPAVDLPETAPFGAVEIDSAACTLCMACANVCPTRALRSHHGNLALGFVESRCLQCRLCERACPEAAIALMPRLLLDAKARHAERRLNEDSPHSCPQCGKPFAGQALLRRSIDAMRKHGYPNTEGLTFLRCCPGCRAGVLGSGLGALAATWKTGVAAKA